MRPQRGLDRAQEQDAGRLIRDTRTLGQRISEDFLRNAQAVALAMLLMAISCYWFAAIFDFILLINTTLFVIVVLQKGRLPFRMPERSGKTDYNDLAPGTRKARKAAGIYFFGNENKTNKELWFSNEDMRTHVLIFGSTGSGKTELLVSLAYNALVQGSGFIYVDGKGDNSLFAKVFSMVKYMGREDDVLLINFMTGAKDVIGPQEKRLSNTLNPFATGSSGMLSNLVVSMMDSSSASSDGDMWKGRAIAFVEAIFKILVAMRDAGNILLDANSIRNYFPLDRIEAMVMDNTFIRDGQYSIDISNLPSEVIEPVKNYLFTLPGFNKERKNKQVSQVFEQHGYIIMQLTRVFSALADTYGHIMRTKLAEVDLKDVVLNRRILVTLLPALEKSPDELSNLGKIIIATLRTMMAAGLGEAVEGTYADLVEKKPTNAPTPYLCILDEYGYYAVKGFAVVPAQARSLGFSVVFAGQDLPAFQKASKEEAASIGANTNIKICMKLEDPTETWDFFMKSAGESYVTAVDSFQANVGSLTSSYMDTRGAKTEKRARIDLQDLKEQGLGDYHIFFKSTIIRGRSFYANPPPVKEMRLNQMLKVGMPSDTDLYNLVKGIEDFEALCAKPFKPYEDQPSADIERLVQTWAAYKSDSSVETGIQVLITLHNQSQTDQSIRASEEPVALGDAGLNIFMRVQLSDEVLACLGGEKDFFEQPILVKKQVLSGLNYALRILGKVESEAEQTAQSIIQDISSVTHYTRPEDLPCTAEQLASTTEQLVENIRLTKANRASDTSGDQT